MFRKKLEKSLQMLLYLFVLHTDTETSLFLSKGIGMSYEKQF